LSTRRAETEVELRDGQTFAIAGLMNNTVTSTMQKIPGIGDIPILGLLFKSKAAQKAQTELVVMITPQIVRAGSPGAAPGLPSLYEPYLGKPAKVLPPPTPWSGSTSMRSENEAPASAPAPVPAANAPQMAPPVQHPLTPPPPQNGTRHLRHVRRGDGRGRARRRFVLAAHRRRSGPR